MRTLIYSVNFAPDLTGIGKYSGDMAAWLAEQGHEVRVVAAPPYYPNWKLQPGYTAPTYRRESWRGISVWRAPIWVPRSPTGLKRILHLASFALTSWPIMLWQVLWRPDIVLTVAPAFVCAPAGWLTARLCGARAWLHLQDFEVDVAFELGLVKGEPVRRAVLQMERWLLRRFDAVSSISNRMIERLIKKGVRKERTLFFPNWVDISRIAASSGDTGYRDQLSIPAEALVVLFSGTLGGKQGLAIIPEVAKILADRKDIVFVICGDGVMKAQLRAETASLPNVRHLPLQPLERLGDLLSSADIQVLPQCPGAADLVMPSKLSGMLASGRPVIATCDRGTEIEAVVSRCGVVVPPEDRAALAAAICRLADEPATRRALGARARDYAAQNFDRDAVLGRVFARPARNEEIATIDLVPTTDDGRMVVNDSAALSNWPQMTIARWRSRRIRGDDGQRTTDR